MRGASPVVAVVLMLLITVAAAGAAYFWITKMQSSLFEQTQTGITQSAKDVYGSIEIVSVWNESTKLCLLIRNTSKQNIRYTTQDLREIAILIDGRPYSLNESMISSPLDPGESLIICLCNQTDSNGCANAITYKYLPSSGAYPLISIKLDPPFGTGDTYDYKYEE